MGEQRCTPTCNYVLKNCRALAGLTGKQLKGKNQCVEGENKFSRIVIIKFPSYEKAMEWYNSEEYKSIKKIRLDNSEGSNIIIKGV